jgi:hypothetical protein
VGAGGVEDGTEVERPAGAAAASAQPNGQPAGRRAAHG